MNEKAMQTVLTEYVIENANLKLQIEELKQQLNEKENKNKKEEK